MAHWICATETPSSPRFYYFTKEFDAPSGATLTAHMCGDTRYALYLNGHLVSEGPCQGSSFQTYYETEDLTPYLVAGVNLLVAKVLYVTEEYFVSLYRRSKPAFWFDGTLTAANESIPIVTDHTWGCAREDACKFHMTHGIHSSTPPCEDWNGPSAPVPVPLRVLYEPNLAKHSINTYGQAEPYILSPRPIPQMETESATDLIPVRCGQGFIEYDAGAYTTAKVTFTFTAPKGSVIHIIYAECYTVADAHGNRYKALRDDHDNSSATLSGLCDTVVATGERQSFSPFWFRPFRFVRLEWESDANITVETFTYAFYHYPLDGAGWFACSNERFNEMWKISRNTVLCCMHEMYVDCPYYEQQQYQMDSALEMLFTLRMSGDDRMPFKSLTDLGDSQRADGMLQANFPSTKIQVIPGFTLFWALMLRDYLLYTGAFPEKLSRVRALTGTLDKALESFEPYRTSSGLIGATPYWHFVDWVPSWRAGIPTGGQTEPTTVTSLMYIAALRAGSEIATAVGRFGIAAEYEKRASEMIELVKAQCYDNEVGLFRDIPSMPAFSQHTTVWAILSGTVTGEEAGALVDRTFDGHVPVHSCTFSMSHYMFRALERANRYTHDYVTRLMAGWEHMLDLHCTTWCENPDSPRSECHGWSSAPIYEFSAMVLGVTPTENGYRTVRIKPCTNVYDLTWAKGTVPTPRGCIGVAWEKQNGIFSLDVTLPDGVEMPATVILPDGTTHLLCSGSARYTCKV